ncbi:MULTISPECIES: LysR family transcriptional regulator [unclassified Duganella]|uniref:LysR family transcriptional regulator n=1 Tax=unclassified Duganella TaxID=2636909 RepID=UPI0006F86974|nr:MULTISPECIES: LysR family transcriptional regulator [unclassified Duganella]KQV44771.1 LysR family transcriptional regulator [Duganella sp. Root336D2]KRB83292.1 LysR family transcriptional regulator [Duganella sp. Root198D2]
MDQLKGMQSFVRVVETGSLSAAARDAGITQPTVSKTISNLERTVGARLLERSFTGLTVTDAGKRFYEQAKRVLDAYEEALADVHGAREQPSGAIRVSAPVGIGQAHLSAAIQHFLETHPKIQVELILNDRMIDLVEEGVDLAVRLGGELPGNLIARKIASSPRVLLASPQYLDRFGAPAALEELADHNFVRYAWLQGGDRITFHREGQASEVAVRGRFRINSSHAVRECLASGFALGMAPLWLVGDLLQSGQLVRILPAWEAAPHEVHILYPSRRFVPVRTRALIEFLQATIPAWPGMEKV